MVKLTIRHLWNSPLYFMNSRNHSSYAISKNDWSALICTTRDSRVFPGTYCLLTNPWGGISYLLTYPGPLSPDKPRWRTRYLLTNHWGGTRCFLTNPWGGIRCLLTYPREEPVVSWQTPNGELVTFWLTTGRNSFFPDQPQGRNLLSANQPLGVNPLSPYQPPGMNLLSPYQPPGINPVAPTSLIR